MIIEYIQINIKSSTVQHKTFVQFLYCCYCATAAAVYQIPNIPKFWIAVSLWNAQRAAAVTLYLVFHIGFQIFVHIHCYLLGPIGFGL